MSDLDFIVCKLCWLHSDWPSHTVRALDFAPGLHAHTHEMWSLYNKLHLDFQRQDWFPRFLWLHFPSNLKCCLFLRNLQFSTIEYSAVCTDVLSGARSFTQHPITNNGGQICRCSEKIETHKILQCEKLQFCPKILALKESLPKLWKLFFEKRQHWGHVTAGEYNAWGSGQQLKLWGSLIYSDVKIKSGHSPLQTSASTSKACCSALWRVQWKVESNLI